MENLNEHVIMLIILEFIKIKYYLLSFFIILITISLILLVIILFEIHHESN